MQGQKLLTFFSQQIHIIEQCMDEMKDFRINPLLIPLFHTGHESPESPRIDFFLDSGGFVRFHFFFSNRYVVRVIPDSDTISLRIRLSSAGIAQEFITISKIT